MRVPSRSFQTPLISRCKTLPYAILANNYISTSTVAAPRLSVPRMRPKSPAKIRSMTIICVGGPIMVFGRQVSQKYKPSFLEHDEGSSRYPWSSRRAGVSRRVRTRRHSQRSARRLGKPLYMPYHMCGGATVTSSLMVISIQEISLYGDVACTVFYLLRHGLYFRVQQRAGGPRPPCSHVGVLPFIRTVVPKSSSTAGPTEGRLHDWVLTTQSRTTKSLAVKWSLAKEMSNVNRAESGQATYMREKNDYKFPTFCDALK